MTQTVRATGRFTGTAQLTSTKMYVLDCASCGVLFGITSDYEDRRREDGRTFYCPNGHENLWTETEVQRLTRQLARTKEHLEWADASKKAWRDQAEAAERRRRAAKGQLTRLRNRIAAGICPVSGCKETGFTDSRLVKHINAEHPEWAHDHSEVIEVTP